MRTWRSSCTAQEGSWVNSFASFHHINSCCKIWTRKAFLIMHYTCVRVERERTYACARPCSFFPPLFAAIYYPHMRTCTAQAQCSFRLCCVGRVLGTRAILCYFCFFSFSYKALFRHVDGRSPFHSLKIDITLALPLLFFSVCWLSFNTTINVNYTHKHTILSSRFFFRKQAYFTTCFLGVC